MVFIYIKKIVVGVNRSNCYFVSKKGDKGDITLIDPGAEGQKILNEIGAIEGEIKKIINTHGHFDHIGGNKYLKERTEAPIMIHYKEKDYLQDPQKNLSSLLEIENVVSPPADYLLRDNEEVEIGGNIFKVILTQGHSPGGISLYCAQENIIFCGDIIFKTGIGRVDLPGSSREKLKNSIEKILEYDDNTVLYPGHGELTTIGEFKEIWKDLKLG